MGMFSTYFYHILTYQIVQFVFIHYALSFSTIIMLGLKNYKISKLFLFISVYVKVFYKWSIT